MEVVASHVEEADVNGVGVISGDSEMHSCCWVLVDQSKNAEICQVGSVDKGKLGFEPPMSRYSENCVFDVWASLLRTVFFNIFENHAYELFQRNSLIALSEHVGAVFEEESFNRSFTV